MTFNNWKELCIGGNKLKRLVRVSDGLVLFELPTGPDYSEPFWIQGDGVTVESEISFSSNVDPSTISPIVMSQDKKSWTPIEWTKNPFGNNSWNSQIFYSTDSRKIYFMRDSEVPIGFGLGSDAQMYIFSSEYNNPSFTIGGNINSLLCKNFSTLTDISGLEKCFSKAFVGGAIMNADALLLPAESIGLSCYSEMAQDLKLTSFGVEVPVENIPSYGCYGMLQNSKNLVNGPKFPNLKSVDNRGLADAFRGCSSLSSVELPSAPILVRTYGFNYAFSESGIKTVENLSLSGIGSSGCQGMFSNCSALTSVNDLYLNGSSSSGSTAANKCIRMFQNCNALLSVSGVISGMVGPAQLRYMFQNCKSLKDASKLSVEVNYGQFYAQSMFQNCSELESMPVLLSGKNGTSNYRYQYAFRNCTKLKNVNPLPDVRPYPNMYNQMFYNCTSMTDAPEIMLPSANSLNCMTNMFAGCTSLSSVTVHFKAWPSGTQLNGWLSGVAPTGIFRCPAELPDQRGNGRIPEGWTKVDL